MKTIILAPKNSLYKKLNGLTFDVEKVMLNGLFCVNIKGVLTDFSASEILIVDFEKHFQSAYDAYNWGSDSSTYNSLRAYKEIRTIDFEPEYNCPA